MIVLALVLLCISNFENVQSSPTRSKRMVEGTEAFPGEFPYQVSIRNTYSHQHHCGGVIIHEKHVLTAAHCVDQFDPEDFEVMSGSINLKKPGPVNQVIAIHVAKNFQQPGKNDVAVLEVQDYFIFDDLTAPANLPAKNYVIPEGSHAVMSGFGRTVAQGANSDLLRKAKTKISNLDLCRKMYPKNFFDDSMICTTNLGRQGICRGDSGGPLVVQGIVVGITSYTNYGCADTNYPLVFANVSQL
ncbi:trypsin-7-like [Trichogramma pretiosum]|uniref:trypsin-7-like n=1 Tax=Trichogramma pretiosum TaxID=7493 RepID=UPI0006C9C608|nr:trypsin-7-like [Trichogramma pretiosum]